MKMYLEAIQKCKLLRDIRVAMLVLKHLAECIPFEVKICSRSNQPHMSLDEFSFRYLKKEM